MEAATIKVPVGKIISSTDRKYGGEGKIETLAQSIEQHGLIHPLAVKESAEKKGCYRVIAGRRRYEAVKLLGWKNVEVTVYADDADDAAIALAENVNREDMHPLDEAETFKRLQDEGKTVEEIAKYYSRTVSGIYHRIRLTNLIDGIKMMFRDGKIKLSGAAYIQCKNTPLNISLTRSAKSAKTERTTPRRGCLKILIRLKMFVSTANVMPKNGRILLPDILPNTAAKPKTTLFLTGAYRTSFQKN